MAARPQDPASRMPGYALTVVTSSGMDSCLRLHTHRRGGISLMVVLKQDVGGARL